MEYAIPRFSRISWKSRDDAEPPSIESRSDAAKRRRSEREIPGAPMQRWYCSVSFRWKRSPGGGVCPNGRRARGVRRTGASLWRSKRSSSESSRSCVMLPAAETTMFTPLYIARWYAAIARLLTVEMTSAVPITGRPRACSPKTAWEKRSCTSSCGVSSYIAISSSTTSRSWSSSANRGAKTMSVITSSASSTCLSGTRENTTVCSREVAAFSSAPIASNVSAICCASYERDPLNNRCSMKCETPARSLRSSREPAPIQKPIETERTLGTFSEITRSPESSSERTYFCTDPTIQRRASRRAWRNGARCTGALGVAIARTQGAPIAVLSARPRTPQRGVQRGRAAQPLFRQALLGGRNPGDPVRPRERDASHRRRLHRERDEVLGLEVVHVRLAA